MRRNNRFSGLSGIAMVLFLFLLFPCLYAQDAIPALSRPLEPLRIPGETKEMHRGMRLITVHDSLPASFTHSLDNVIEDENRSLSPFFQKLNDMTGPVRIVHIGDSHVRGHLYPLITRHRLEHDFGAEAVYPDVISYRTGGLAHETGEPGIVYHMIGINGATSVTFSDDEKIKETKEEITKLESEKQNVKIANDKINIFLEYIFMSKNKLRIEYDVNKKIYLVKSHNKDIRPKDLSTGERNIIALCYFFVKILENTSEINEFKEEIFIVLDDPISSFDMENKVGLFTFFRMMFNKIMKNNEKSKIISFTHSLETMFNLEKICSDIKINLNITYCLLELKDSKLEDFAYKRRNDYKKMLEDIYKYAKIEDDKIENELDDTIGNTMRKLLEAYSTFNYNKGIEEVTRNKNILEKVEDEDIKQYFENFMYRLILNNESHTFDETRSLNFYDFISRDEKIKTARSILILLNILDNTHLKSYLDSEDYTKELKIWENEIIPKKTIAN